LWICLEGGILTLLIDWNNIDEDYHVVRVEGGLYDCFTVWKRTIGPNHID